MNTSTLFIDESGKSSLADQENQPFLITGVVLDNTELGTVEGYFRYIKRKYNIPAKESFHSYHIYEHPGKKLPDSQLILLSQNLADFIDTIPIDINVVYIDKQEFRSALGVKTLDDFKGSKERKEMKDFPYRALASFLFGCFGKYLDEKGHIGQIIADSRKGGDYQLLKTLHLCKEKVIPFNPGYREAVKDRVTAICFAEKGFLSGGLEITDIISYISYHRIKRLILANKSKGSDLLWKAIRKRKKMFVKIDKNKVRRFFNLKKGEVHKYLKST